jgi:ribosomal protein L40E
VTASLIADEDYVLGVYRDAADGQYRMNETSFIREYNLRDMDKVLLVREEREAFRSATAAAAAEAAEAAASSSPPTSGDLSFGPAPNKKAPKPQKKATPSPYGAVPNFAGEPVGCVKCDAVSPPSADACVECSGELDPFMCVRCSLRYPTSKIFCSECGVKLPGAELPDEQASVAPAARGDAPPVTGAAVTRKATERSMTLDRPSAVASPPDDADLEVTEVIPLEELCDMVLSFRIDEVKTYIKTKPVADAERITLELTARLEALAAETTAA